MIDRRLKNIEIFEDTMELIDDSKMLQDALTYSVNNQILYLETDSINVSDFAEGNNECKTIVSRKRSLEAASIYSRAGKKVCVLNFASATNPGGGVTNGSSAQEEALCRCSTLYPCLAQNSLWDSFYKPHRALNNPLYNDDCIYTPEVFVVKSDVSYPERMPEEEWYKVDIITCAAPNLRHMPSNFMNPFAGEKAAQIDNGNLLKMHIKRIERIFEVAITNGAQVLILGAFGCGAFCNPPETVAKAFKTVQQKYGKYFETIEYAIYCRDHETANYKAFQMNT